MEKPVRRRKKAGLHCLRDSWTSRGGGGSEQVYTVQGTPGQAGEEEEGAGAIPTLASGWPTWGDSPVTRSGVRHLSPTWMLLLLLLLLLQPLPLPLLLLLLAPCTTIMPTLLLHWQRLLVSWDLSGATFDDQAYSLTLSYIL